jgi:hypothetical protein
MQVCITASVDILKVAVPPRGQTECFPHQHQATTGLGAHPYD